MRINTRYRSLAPEIMDDFNMEGELLTATLDKIAQINFLLGGNRITRKGVAALIKNIPIEQEITIVDIGCGNGDMLRQLSDTFSAQRNITLTGIDANLATVTHARNLSKNYRTFSIIARTLLNLLSGINATILFYVRLPYIILKKQKSGN